MIWSEAESEADLKKKKKTAVNANIFFFFQNYGKTTAAERGEGKEQGGRKC